MWGPLCHLGGVQADCEGGLRSGSQHSLRGSTHWLSNDPGQGSHQLSRAATLELEPQFGRDFTIQLFVPFQLWTMGISYLVYKI